MFTSTPVFIVAAMTLVVRVATAHVVQTANVMLIVDVKVVKPVTTAIDTLTIVNVRNVCIAMTATST